MRLTAISSILFALSVSAAHAWGDWGVSFPGWGGGSPTPHATPEIDMLAGAAAMAAVGAVVAIMRERAKR